MGTLGQWGWLLGTSVGVLALTGCGWRSPQTLPPPPEETVSATPVPTSEVATPPVPSPTLPPAASHNFFKEGVNRAQSAVAIGQTAQSKDDWILAANRWKQAMSLMQQVPATDPNHATAQQKVKEYGQNAALAERRAAGEVPPTAAPPVDVNRPPGLVARIPVLRQVGGTPVVPVSLTGTKGTQQVTMLFDTGASGTLITQAMADAIGVVIMGTASVMVADGRQVEIPIGYVDTLKVGDLVVRDITVGIGGDVGLLGQDVYGEYGLSIGGSSIDLYE